MKRGIIIFILLIFSFSFISAAITHPAVNVFVDSDGIIRNLETEATYFIGGGIHSSVSDSAIVGHDASQIWVSVKDGEMTLLDALSSKNRLCPSSTKPLIYTSANIPDPSHLATEIQLASGKNFQQAINEGSFCTYYSWGTSAWGAWSSTDLCSGSQTRTAYCKRNIDGANMGTTCGTYLGCECASQPKTTQYRRCWWHRQYYTEKCKLEGTRCSNYDYKTCYSYALGNTFQCGEPSCGFLNLGRDIWVMKCEQYYSYYSS